MNCFKPVLCKTYIGFFGFLAKRISNTVRANMLRCCPLWYPIGVQKPCSITLLAFKVGFAMLLKSNAKNTVRRHLGNIKGAELNLLY